MGEAYAKPSKRPKPATEDVLGKFRRSPRWFQPVIVAWRKRFPQGSAKDLAYLAGTSDRSAETWIGKKGAPEGEVLFRLINSDIGDLVIEALTADCQKSWAKGLRRQIELTRLLDAQDELDLRIKALQRRSA